MTGFPSTLSITGMSGIFATGLFLKPVQITLAPVNLDLPDLDVSVRFLTSAPYPATTPSGAGCRRQADMTCCRTWSGFPVAGARTASVTWKRCLGPSPSGAGISSHLYSGFFFAAIQEGTPRMYVVP